MKGIVLAGGYGTRLHPLTLGVSKQLLPIYDKPMIYYPISVLMLAGIRKILIISTPYDLPSFKKLLGSGKQFGVEFKYAEQKAPNGLAEAFLIGEDFIADDDVCLVLGDNVFYGSGFQKLLKNAIKLVADERKAVVFGKYVSDPKRYGVAVFNKDKSVINIEEKPKNPKSNYAVVGLYFYPNSVVNIAKSVRASDRGELEITSVNQSFLENDDLKLEILSRGYAWLDTGTHETLTDAAEFVKAIEKSTGLKIACLEEIALNYKWVSKEMIADLISNFKGAYFDYLKKIISN